MKRLRDNEPAGRGIVRIVLEHIPRILAVLFSETHTVGIRYRVAIIDGKIRVRPRRRSTFIFAPLQTTLRNGMA